MRNRIFEELITDYGNWLHTPDIEIRKKYLLQNKYSIIIEGEFNEIDNFEKWVHSKFSKTKYKKIFYGKLSYDFGYFEYFFDNKEILIQGEKIISRIYTKYPNAHPKVVICRSEGWEKQINYNSNDFEAIIM